MKITPLILVLAYNFLTLALFWFGPFDWATRGSWVMPAILIISWSALGVGYIVGYRIRQGSKRALSINPPVLIGIGTALNVVTFPGAFAATTGASVQDLSFRLADQGAVYASRIEFLGSASFSLFDLAVIVTRALISPLFAVALFLGFLNWGSLDRQARLLVVVNVLIQLGWSFGKGTDKELVDVVVFFLAATYLKSGQRISLKQVLGAGLIVLVVLSVFTARRDARSAASGPVCVQSTCVSEVDSDRLFGIYARFSSYSTQGYHGLALAADLDDRTRFGLGTFPVVNVLFSERLGLDESPTLQAELAERGWPPENQWSSAYTDIANDVTISFVPLVFLGLGFLLSRKIQGAGRGDILDGLVLAYLAEFFLYAPANNQLGVSLESTVQFLVILGLSLRFRLELKSPKSEGGNDENSGAHALSGT